MEDTECIMTNFKLFSHQEKALDLTKNNNNVAYYVDLGLGKTFIAGEKALSLGASLTLVVCQKSKVTDWCDHFLEYYSDHPVYDLTAREQALMDFCSADRVMGVGVINYDLIFRRPQLQQLENFTLILDESSLIRHESAKRTKFIMKMQPDNVILLSGTPSGGKYEELWTQCHLLGWRISKDLYWKQYIETEWVDQDGFKRQKVTGYKNVDRLKRKLAEYGAVFMTTDDAGIDLPKQNFSYLKGTVPKEYKRFMKDRITTIEDETLVGDTTLTKLLYARQLCSLYNQARYEAFEDLVDSTSDRLIVFYNFTEEFERMLQLIDGRSYSVINGTVKDLSAYEIDNESITFVQYQAGAMGVNLQLANKIIYFSLPLSWELFEQSQKRIHRIGQDRSCFYYIMMCKNTVEERILKTIRMRKNYNDKLFEKEGNYDQY